MIVLFTDFGLTGPYTGQMKAVLAQRAPGRPVIDLFADAPAFNPRASAYLLAAYAEAFPPGSIFCCVVDPGVGGRRRALVCHGEGRSFVGPDNGLMAVVMQRTKRRYLQELTLDPGAAVSASFHGRDIFAPVAAELAVGRRPRPPFSLRAIAAEEIVGWDWPDDLAEVAYIDVYGNAMTGLRAARLPQGARLGVGERVIAPARTFSDVTPGEAFWYENANGLAEIAVNQGRADSDLGLSIGAEVAILPPAG